MFGIVFLRLRAGRVGASLSLGLMTFRMCSNHDNINEQNSMAMGMKPLHHANAGCNLDLRIRGLRSFDGV